jgi:hypothetical protein
VKCIYIGMCMSMSNAWIKSLVTRLVVFVFAMTERIKLKGSSFVCPFEHDDEDHRTLRPSVKCYLASAISTRCYQLTGDEKLPMSIFLLRKPCHAKQKSYTAFNANSMMCLRSSQIS